MGRSTLKSLLSIIRLDENVRFSRPNFAIIAYQHLQHYYVHDGLWSTFSITLVNAGDKIEELISYTAKT